MGETETDVAVVAPAAEPPAVARCENCEAVLQGEYCHACGQSVHSPLRHAGHALEEIFESFWHLDGRIFRTLRDLLVPGRVARGYIAGHRARYIAPLRLFVILSLLTFFVAQYSVELDGDTIIQIDPETGVNVSAADGDAGRDARNSFAQARTVAEVERIRDRELAEIAKARELVPAGIPGARSGIDAGMRAMRAQAQRRIEELRKASPAGDAGKTVAATTSQAAGSGTEASRMPDGGPIAARSKASPSSTAASPPLAATQSAAPAPEANDREMAWDARANPIDLPWLPAFANQWLTAQSDRASRNAVQIRKDPQRWLRAVIGAVPSTLFLLVPVFALLLKIFYLFKRRLYLEHLVVALYSHAFLLLSLLAIFASMALRHALGAQAPWLGTAFGWFEGLLWIWMPIYLLLMQKLVYRQGWPMTLLKYAVLGTVYFMLLMFGALATFFYSLVRM